MSDSLLTPILVERLEDLPRAPHIVTIGSFDGVHRGHQFVLRAAEERAEEAGLPLLAVTFEPLPAQVLRPDQFRGRLCSREVKLGLLATSGPQSIVVLPFTHEFSRLSADEFMAMLATTATPREVWVGEAFALGRDRAGNMARLQALGAELGYRLEAVPRLEDETGVISSSAIRELILNGDPGAAARKLGRLFRVEGEVIHGAHVGRTIGFPTANVVPPVEIARLPDGIYATYADLPEAGSRLPSMTYIGTRPALNTGARLIETHVLDFDGDLYGQWIGVEFVARLRGDATFSSVPALVAQLQADEVATRAALADHDVGTEKLVDALGVRNH